jgi:hypothetical protein
MQNTRFHVTIKPKAGRSLRMKKESERTPSDTLPEHIGTIFKSREEVKEEVQRKSFKDFII